MLNGEQVGGLLRLVIVGLSGWAIAKGYGDAALWTSIAGGAAIVGAGVWSLFTNKPGTVIPTPKAVAVGEAVAKEVTVKEVAAETVAIKK